MLQCQLSQMPDDIKLESLCLLAKLYSSQNQFASAITLLQQAYDLSTQQPYWHCRIIFQIIVNAEYNERIGGDLLFHSRVSIIRKMIIIQHCIMSIVELSFVRELMPYSVNFFFN